MAKIAICGYGSRGQGVKPDGSGYAYVVNDNVRTKDIIQVISTSRKGNKFPTTASPLNTYKADSAKGQQLKTKIQDQIGKELTNAYSGKELRAKGSKVAPPEGQSQYTMATRAEALKVYQHTHPEAQISEKTAREYNTFDSYSKKFMPKGEEQ